METIGIRAEERIGLAVAVMLHLALLALLIAQALMPAPVAKPPQRMTVSLAEDVGLAATAPDPVAESRASTAPTLDANPAPAPATADPVPAPPVERPVPPQVQSPVPVPKEAADSRQRRRPDPPRTQNRPRRSANAASPAKASSPQRSAPAPRKEAPAPSSPRSGGSRLSDNFLDGAGDSASTGETRVPASQIGASAKASIQQALARQIKPHWNSPQGIDVELLVTLLDFDLNPDGSLRGAPRVRSQSGETDSNRPQKALHAERAIRAVQLAAPFNLPPEYYNAWKAIRGARFDRNLSR